MDKGILDRAVLEVEEGKDFDRSLEKARYICSSFLDGSAWVDL